MPHVSAAVFDDAFRAGAVSSGRRQVYAHAAPGLPAYVEPASFVDPPLLLELLAELALAPGELLVDLACGRGGPGFWLARQAAARLVGIDFSAVAVEQAAARFPSARFTVGELIATGLPDAYADGVVCIDAVHFASDPTDACREAYRILKPGRRLVMTNWAPRTPGDPALGRRLRDLDWVRVLTDAGFTHVRVEARADWHALYVAVFEAALAQGDPGNDDPALAALQAEARALLPKANRKDRVLLVGTRPAPER
jgi:SAM-dependent methyltransferase